MNGFWEGPVPVLWGRASYEMFQVEHGGVGNDVPSPYWKCSLWNISAAADWNNRPGWPGDVLHGPAGLWLTVTPASPFMRRGIYDAAEDVIPVYRDLELVTDCPILSSRT